VTEELTEAIRLAMQWLFTPLLALVALAWLCLRLEAAGTFDAILGSVRKMSVFQRFAAAAFLAVFNNPFGWNEKDTNGDTSPFRRFGESIRDEIMLDSNGTVGIRKLNKQVTRTTNNVIRIGGVLVQ
jgi:hypothetical protein